MCIRDSRCALPARHLEMEPDRAPDVQLHHDQLARTPTHQHPDRCRADLSDDHPESCLLYTSDAADERSSVDLGGRRIIKKKKKVTK